MLPDSRPGDVESLAELFSRDKAFLLQGFKDGISH
jgi:hypothetical protein